MENKTYLSPGIHGVIVIHGIGDQRAGDTLAGFAKGLCDSLINSPRASRAPSIQLKSSLMASPPSVTLQITSPYGENATWLCREAYWNDAFPPPNPTQVLWWGVNQNLRSQIASMVKLLRDPSNEKLPTESEQEKERAKSGKDTSSVKTSRKANAQVRAKSGLISGIVLVPLTILAYIVLGLIWLLHFLPSIGILDKVIDWVRKLDPLLSGPLGDIQRYVDHEIWSANARARVEEAVISMLQDDEIEDITLVAHSLGSIVTYDALTEGGNIAKALASGSKKRKKITFISVGGAINRVFSIVSPERKTKRKDTELKYNASQLTKPLAKIITGFGDSSYTGNLEDRFFWLDIFARRDPVPAGPIAKRIIAKVGINPAKQIKERIVINKDSLIFDHNAYWDNKELVMPRIARAINGGKEYPWPEAGITEKKLARRVQIAIKYGDLIELGTGLVSIGAIVFVVLKLTGIL